MSGVVKRLRHPVSWEPLWLPDPVRNQPFFQKSCSTQCNWASRRGATTLPADSNESSRQNARFIHQTGQHSFKRRFFSRFLNTGSRGHKKIRVNDFSFFPHVHNSSSLTRMKGKTLDSLRKKAKTATKGFFASSKFYSFK